MRIKELKLYTNKLTELYEFYSSNLEFKILNKTAASFCIQAGYSKLKFEQSKKGFIYHFCFLIPSNKLQDSIDWLKKRTTIISYENGRLIEPANKEWNADSIYFLDPAGNILEFIVRYDLKNESTKNSFDISQVLCVNEIGMPSKDLSKINTVLEKELDSKLWTGDLKRFGANGTQNGLFLLVNYEIKKNWFPTETAPYPSPFTGTFESNGNNFNLTFKNEKITLCKKH